MEFLALHELAILRFLHILAMVYWLGGEWAVYQTSNKVVDPSLTTHGTPSIKMVTVLQRIGKLVPTRVMS